MTGKSGDGATSPPPADKVTPSKSSSSSCCHGKSGEKRLYKISELPLYGNPNPPKDRILNKEDTSGSLERQIRTARHAVQDTVLDPVGRFVVRGEEIMTTGIAHSQQTLTWASEEANSVAKAGIIAAGGLLGLLFSARRGLIRKTLFISAGMGLGSWVTYPKETAEAVDVGFYIVRNKGPQLFHDLTGVDLASNDIWNRMKNTFRSGDQRQAEQRIPVEELDRNLLNRENLQNRDQSNPTDSDLYANRSSK